MSDPAAEPTPLERVWARTTVAAESPNGRVRATMVGDHELRVWIDPTWYDATSGVALQEELARVARLTYVNRTRAYYDAWSALTGERMSPVRTPVSEEQAEYQRRLEQVAARGEAYGGRIALVLVGTSHFSVEIDSGVLHQIDAPTFCTYAAQAALACLREHEQGWQRAHFDVYTRPRLERAGLL